MNNYLRKLTAALAKPVPVITIGILLLLTVVSYLGTHAQTSCTTYYQCSPMQEISPNKLTGPVTYWFDNSQIVGTSFLTAEQADNFRQRVAAAATDWTTRTGMVFQEVPSGGSVRIRISGATFYRDRNGVVDDDQSFPGKKVMTYSVEWPLWTAAGKDRLTSHEWGHIIGFKDVTDTGCAGVETIMRQFSSNPAIAEEQLRGTQPLPAPERPNACDACAAKDKQAGVALGTSCATPSPSPTPTPTPNNQPDCELAGFYWNFSNSTCNEEPQNCPGFCRPYQPLESGACEFAYDYCAWPWGCPYGYTDGGSGCCCLPTPILIDVAGNGFALTDAYSGVGFDMGGDGHSEPIAWTRAGSDDAWLVLDRNHNGRIDSAQEMFGNFTEQPDTAKIRNGFVALAEFDRSENGGNQDGRINNSDSVFSNLRLWQDKNQNGVSEVAELHTLNSLNVASLDLDFKESKKEDKNDNKFSYRAKVSDVRGHQLGRWAWDVTLSVNPPPLR